jgi:hypothetical protein
MWPTEDLFLFPRLPTELATLGEIADPARRTHRPGTADLHRRHHRGIPLLRTCLAVA